MSGRKSRIGSKRKRSPSSSLSSSSPSSSSSDSSDERNSKYRSRSRYNKFRRERDSSDRSVKRDSNERRVSRYSNDRSVKRDRSDRLVNRDSRDRSVKREGIERRVKRDSRERSVKRGSFDRSPKRDSSDRSVKRDCRDRSVKRNSIDRSVKRQKIKRETTSSDSDSSDDDAKTKKRTQSVPALGSRKNSDVRLKIKSCTTSKISIKVRSSSSKCCTPERDSTDNYRSTPRTQPYSNLDKTSRFDKLRRKSDSSLFYKVPRESPLEQFVARSRAYKNTFIDSHCHIDFIFQHKRLDPDTTYREFLDSQSESMPDNFEGCVAVFCNPSTFRRKYAKDNIFRKLADEEGVWFTFGCHPKHATEFDQTHEEGLRQYLSHSKVVALGEIGLDYSGTFYQHSDVQQRVFRTQLKIALDMFLPIVIHCRDAEDDCLEIMEKLVPKKHRIHLHCFTKDMISADRWLSTFPNLYIGLTPVITYQSAVEPMTVAARIPLDRLLLETDSPYFVPGGFKKYMHVSHPGLALVTAERIAELRGVAVDVVLKACRQNTKKMYGI